jgi:hypothetical protein
VSDAEPLTRAVLESGEPGVQRRRTAAPAAATLATLGELVEAWGGEWNAETRELRLPLQAGVRHGWASGRAEASERIGGSDLVLRMEEPRWSVDRPAVLMLLMGAASGLCAVLWPFFPPLARFVPIGLVLGASVWLVVLSRLRHRGVVELLDDVEEALGGDRPDDG